MGTKYDIHTLHFKKLAIAFAALFVFVIGFPTYAYTDDSTQNVSESSSLEDGQTSIADKDSTALDDSFEGSSAGSIDPQDSEGEGSLSAEGGSLDGENSPEPSSASSEENTSTTSLLDDESNESVGVVVLKNGKALSEGDPIYVNGSAGDDSNPGTATKPVKTFAKAKELMEKYHSEIIWVSGALDLMGTTETWDLGGKTMMREGEFTGELVRLSNGANLTLKNIILDGGLENGSRGASTGDGGGGSLVGVYSKSVLTIGANATLQNNAYKTSNRWYPESGGAVYANNSTVNLEGGTITGNMATYGGGICADDHAVVNISSGLITNNTAVKGTNSSLTKGYGGTGGGVCAWRGASVNFSGGTISNNTAHERGGGISIGSYYDFGTFGGSTLTMTGGTIDSNKAGSAGGGIFIQYGYSAEGSGGEPTYCIARISAGTISNNQMTNTGDGNSSFGGGAIYINGVSSAYKDWHSGELYLGNAVITGNSANIAGGGYAGCPSSKTTVKLTNGAVFYGNNTDSNLANELYVLASMAYGSHSDNPEYEVSSSMLGGGAYRWLYDDGTEVPLNKLKGTLNMAMGEELRLNNNLKESDPDVQAGVAEATVFIIGNRSETRGGAIGSNGTFILGSTEYPVEVSAIKVWSDKGKENQRPEELSFELYRDGVYVGYQTVKADDDGVWKTTFKNLPKTDVNGNGYVYTVKERAVDGYNSTVAGDAQSGFVITNTKDVPDKPDEPVVPDEPTTPDESVTPDEPTTPDEPSNSDEPNEPSKSSASDQPYAKTGAQAPDNNADLMLLLAAIIAVAGLALVVFTIHYPASREVVSSEANCSKGVNDK